MVRSILRTGVTTLALTLAQLAGADVRVEAVALMKGMSVLDINGTRQTLREGQVSPEGCRLLSATSSAAAVDCGSGRMTLTLTQRVGGVYAEAQRDVAISANEHGQYWVRGTINGQLVDMLVDTGASAVALSQAQATTLGIRIPSNAKRGFAATAQGVAAATHVMLDTVEVGAIKVHGVNAMIVDGNFPLQILLGMSFLNRVTLQHGDGVMVLRAR